MPPPRPKKGARSAAGRLPFHGCIRFADGVRSCSTADKKMAALLFRTHCGAGPLFRRFALLGWSEGPFEPLHVLFRTKGSLYGHSHNSADGFKSCDKRSFSVFERCSYRSYLCSLSDRRNSADVKTVLVLYHAYLCSLSLRSVHIHM